jgi:hypothetical protein
VKGTSDEHAAHQLQQSGNFGRAVAIGPLPFGALSNFVAAAAQLAIVFQAEIRANCHPLRILKNIYEEF